MARRQQRQAHLARIALDLAPGGLLGDGLARLDLRNRRAVREAFELLTY
jgi:hypothetical protein